MQLTAYTENLAAIRFYERFAYCMEVCAGVTRCVTDAMPTAW